jgi:hypothetical protein
MGASVAEDGRLPSCGSSLDALCEASVLQLSGFNAQALVVEFLARKRHIEVELYSWRRCAYITYSDQAYNKIQKRQSAYH